MTRGHRERMSKCAADPVIGEPCVIHNHSGDSVSVVLSTETCHTQASTPTAQSGRKLRVARMAEIV